MKKGHYSYSHELKGVLKALSLSSTLSLIAIFLGGRSACSSSRHLDAGRCSHERYFAGMPQGHALDVTRAIDSLFLFYFYSGCDRFKWKVNTKV